MYQLFRRKLNDFATHLFEVVRSQVYVLESFVYVIRVVPRNAEKLPHFFGQSHSRAAVWRYVDSGNTLNENLRLLRIQGNVKLTEEVKKCWSADFLRTFLPINRFGDNNSTILHARETEASARTYDKKMATTSTPPVIVPNHCNSLHVAPTPTRAGREDLLLDRTIRCCRWCRCRCRWSAVHPGTLGCAGSSATLPFRSEGQQTSQGTSTFVIPPSDRNAPAKAHVPHFLREACSCTLDCPGCSTQVLPQKPSKNASCQIRQLLRYAA